MQHSHGFAATFQNPEKWIKRYQRNNKRNGLKNLRCFPFCSDPHKEKGYCGRPVRVTISRNVVPGQQNVPLYAWSEFLKIDGPRNMGVGSIITPTMIEQNERDKIHPTRPWYRGELLKSMNAAEDCYLEDEEKEAVDKKDLELLEELRVKQVVTFDFNRRKRGWNYSWGANKHTCNSFHSLFVFLAVPHGNGSFRVVAEFQSPGFQVFCRKRPTRSGENEGLMASELKEDHMPVAQTPYQQMAYNHQMHQQQQQNSMYASNGMQPQVHMHQQQLNAHPPVPSGQTGMYYQSNGDMSSLIFPTHGNNAVKIEQPDAEIPDDAEEFRKFFIDSFWNDEDLNMDDFNTRKRGRTMDDPLVPPTINTPQLQQAQNGMMEHSMPYIKQELPTLNASPQDVATSVFGPSSDGEEEITNEKVWRLVLVFALVEAHWCEVNQSKRKASSSMSSAPRSLDDGDDFGKSIQPTPYTDENAWDGSTDPFYQGEDPPPTLFADSQGGQTNFTFGKYSSEYSEQMDQFLPEMSSDSRVIVQRLATFLIEENSFTRSIEQALSHIPSHATVQERKFAFIKVAHEQIGLFCDDNDLSWNQFDKLFQVQPSVVFLKQAAVRLNMLQDMMNSYNDPKKEKEISESGTHKHKRNRSNIPAHIPAPGEVVLNISGVYQMDADLLAAHAYIREMRGVPWVLRKMIGFVEKTITLEQTGYERVHMQGSKKLLSNGGNLYICDGRMRTYTFTSPVPWSRPLAEGYCAYFRPPVFHLEHHYTETERCVREIVYTDQRLRFDMSFQRLDPITQTWLTVDTRVGYANLIERAANFNADTVKHQFRIYT